MKGLDKIVAGRVRLLFGSIFFGTLVTHLQLVESDAVPTMATDGFRIIFNPEFSDKLSKPEVEGVLAHEVLHLVLLTHLRRGTRDPKLWNYATDFAINLILKDEKFSLPDGCLYDEKFRDWSAEKIYNYLQENPDEQPGEGDGWNIGGVMDAGSAGEDGEGKGAQPMTAEQIETEIGRMKAKIQAAAMGAKKAGQISANINRLIDKICAPKADWKEILRRFVSERAFNDWDFSKCHTRILHSYGIISPVLGSDALGTLAIIVDTSGSVDEKQLAQFAGEISSILENYPCEIHVVYCDTAVNRTDHYTDEDLPLRLHAVGGGGTMGRPAYDWVEEQVKDAVAIIHYTDSYLFDWGQIPQPSCPALMACTAFEPTREVPDWIEHIDIS